MLLRRPRDGRQEKVALVVGKSHLMPVFDVNFRNASALARFAF